MQSVAFFKNLPILVQPLGKTIGWLLKKIVKNDCYKYLAS